MKNRIVALLILFCTLCSNVVIAQMVGDCVFLKGKYVEVGIAPNGGYGSTLPAPVGYHPNLAGTSFTFYDPAAAGTTTSTTFLGFVADFGRDGWTTGAPGYFGDFYLPGTPQEGWAVQVGGIESDAYIPIYQSAPTTGYTGTLAGTNIAYTNSGGISRGIWKGTQGALDIRQTTTLDTTKLFFTVNVVLKNTGAAALNNIYYLRTVDPDNEQTQTGDFTTSNTITYQLPNPGNRVLVSATGIGPFATNAYLGLGTKDCRAKSVIYDFGLDPGGVSLDAIYNQTTTFNYVQGFNLVSDVGIGLVYNIGTLAAGDSTSVTYAYILNAAYIDSALDATQPAFLVNSLTFNSGDTINLCTYNFDTAVISLGSGAFYHWHWSPGTYLSDTTAVSNTIDVNAITSTTTYTITGINVSGACDTVKYYLTLTHDTFNINLSNRDTNICRGNSVNGSLAGPPLLTYSWSPITGVSNPTIMNPVFTPTVTTTYTVTASSSAGCPPVSKHFTITVIPRPVVTVDSHYVKTCVGVPILLHSSGAPATTTYSYTWSPGTNLSSNTVANPTVTPTAAGDVNYTITISPTLVSNCSSFDTVHVHAIGDFTLNNHDTVICLGQSVNVSTSGSTEIGYSWTPATGVAPPNSANPVITPTAQGVYVYSVTGSYAHCPDYVHSFSISVDTPANAMTYSDTICLGMSDVVDFTVPGGAYYHYQWTSTPVAGISFSNDTLPNPVITPSAAGAYVINIALRPSAVSCTINNTLNLLVLPNVITIHPTDTAICAGQVVQVIGVGDPNFTYVWLPTAGIAGYTTLNTLITPDTSALYTVTASFHRCPDIHATLNLDVQPNPAVYIGGNRLLCQFDTLHLNASVNPAWYSGYTYTWAPAADLDHTNTPTVVFSGASTTNIHLVVTTSAGCTGQDSALITVFPGNFASVTGTIDYCPHDTAILSVLPSAGVTYHWHPSIYLDDSLSGTPVIRPVANQTYTIVATTINGCRDTVNFSVNVFPSAVLYLGDSVTLYPGESYHIEPVTNCTSFLWFPPAGLDNIYIADPTATPDVGTQYVVHASTEHGCKASDSFSVYVSPESVVGMPNAFTPGTGINNEFRVLIKGIAKLNHFRVYNRWGNLLFETTDISKGWDGSWKGEQQPFGVYVYDIQAVTNTGKVINKSGNITLIR